MTQDLDSAALELIERRLTESITKSVRTRLFAVYVSIGVAVGVVLSYAGLNVVSEIKRDVEQEIVQKLDRQVTEAKTLADDARADLKIQFQVSSELAKRAGKTFDELDSKLASFSPKMATLDTLQAAVTDLEVKGRNLKTDMDSASQNIGTLAELSTKVETLAKQIGELSKLAGRTSPASDARGYVTITNASNAIAESSAKVSQSIQQTGKGTRVWFQFAVIESAKAAAIADGLKTKGFIIPGVERTPQRSGLYEIRFYWADDRSKADELKKAASDVIGAVAGESRTPKVADYTFWQNTKPKPGTIELWYSPES